jgi:DNA primase
VVIVEGYMDVIQAYQRNARNVVAQMGTALTEAQLKRLAPMASRIVLALDADTAGNAATLRSLSLARQSLPKKHRATSTSRGIELEAHLAQEIYVVALPVDQDPDDVLRQGLEAWQNLVALAVPALDFYEELILAQADLDTPPGKSFVVHELIPVYREIKDNIEKTVRVQRLARKIGIDERLLLVELKGAPEQPRAPGRRRRPSEPPKPPQLPPQLEEAVEPALAGELSGLGLEEYCLALIVAHPAALAMANDILHKQDMPGLSTTDFKRGDNREIFNSLQLWTASEKPKLDLLVEMIGSQTLEQRLAALVVLWHDRPAPPVENINQDLSIAIVRLRLRNVIEQIEELNTLQREGVGERDAEGRRQYTEMVGEYSRQRKKLEHIRDALSLTGQRRAEANRFGQLG